MVAFYEMILSFQDNHKEQWTNKYEKLTAAVSNLTVPQKNVKDILDDIKEVFDWSEIAHLNYLRRLPSNFHQMENTNSVSNYIIKTNDHAEFIKFVNKVWKRLKTTADFRVFLTTVKNYYESIENRNRPDTVIHLYRRIGSSLKPYKTLMRELETHIPMEFPTYNVEVEEEEELPEINPNLKIEFGGKGKTGESMETQDSDEFSDGVAVAHTTGAHATGAHSTRGMKLKRGGGGGGKRRKNRSLFIW
ncbi:hypothetical protein CHUAL_002711 [Chamberlinius hualienensis]